MNLAPSPARMLCPPLSWSSHVHVSMASFPDSLITRKPTPTASPRTAKLLRRPKSQLRPCRAPAERPASASTSHSASKHTQNLCCHRATSLVSLFLVPRPTRIAPPKPRSRTDLPARLHGASKARLNPCCRHATSLVPSFLVLRPA